MAFLKGKASDYVLRSAAVEAVDIAVKTTKEQTLKIASDMIRNATLPEDRVNDDTYRLAQKEFSDMLWFVATGEIDITLVNAVAAERVSREGN